jgi:hypothetical protein
MARRVASESVGDPFTVVNSERVFCERADARRVYERSEDVGS